MAFFPHRRLHAIDRRKINFLQRSNFSTRANVTSEFIPNTLDLVEEFCSVRVHPPQIFLQPTLILKCINRLHFSSVVHFVWMVVICQCTKWYRVDVCHEIQLFEERFLWRRSIQKKKRRKGKSFSIGRYLIVKKRRSQWTRIFSSIRRAFKLGNTF